MSERVSDEQTFRTVIEWIANLSDAELHDYDWRAHRANCRNLLDVSEGGRLDAGDSEENDRWRERTAYLLTTDPSEWEPECIRWLTKAADPSVTKEGE